MPNHHHHPLQPTTLPLLVVLGIATVTTVGCSLLAFAWGYSKGRGSTAQQQQPKPVVLADQQHEEGTEEEELYLQMRNRGRLSFTSDDNEKNDGENMIDDVPSSNSSSGGYDPATTTSGGTNSRTTRAPVLRGDDWCANNWHHFEGYECDGKAIVLDISKQSQQMDSAVSLESTGAAQQEALRTKGPLPPRPSGTTLVPRTANPMRCLHQGRSTSGATTTDNDEDDLTQQLEGEDRRRHSGLVTGVVREQSRIYRKDYPPRNVAAPVVGKATAIIHPPSGINDSGPETPDSLPQRPQSSYRRNLRASSAPASLSSKPTSSPIHSPRKARTQYNARVMPHRLIMIRHGQSMGNVDETLYGTTPDNAMPLTELGWNQAKACGIHLKNTICKNWKTEGIHFIVSPYCRTVETFHGILSAWIDPSEVVPGEDRLSDWYAKLASMGLQWHEDPRLREQDFGNFQDPDVIKQAKKDRHRFGAFYYRFPHGESASDVRCRPVVLRCLGILPGGFLYDAGI
jgi:broad specificity phosphatase PhoE